MISSDAIVWFFDKNNCNIVCLYAANDTRQSLLLTLNFSGYVYYFIIL